MLHSGQGAAGRVNTVSTQSAHLPERDQQREGKEREGGGKIRNSIWSLYGIIPMAQAK